MTVAVKQVERSDGGDAIRRVAFLAEEIGRADLAAEGWALADRVAEGRFHVACVGQFKRGKSTLLNALVGHQVLPAGVVPVTSAVTVLRYGDRAQARVRFLSGATEEVDPASLAAFVAEDQNPENTKQVAAVEVFLPSELLATGMCLVDTPGIGSVFAGNTAVTREFVPQLDAALVVVGADPPISGDEAALVEEVAKQAPDILCVLNKADWLGADEVREAIVFTQRTLERRLGRAIMPVLEVSAAERIQRGPTRQWSQLEEALRSLTARSGAELVRRAQARGLALLAQRVRHDLEEQRDALTRPIEESTRRIAALKRCAAEAEVALGELGYRLAAEQARLGKTFGERRQAFLGAAVPEAHRQLGAALAKSELNGPALRRHAIEVARQLAQQWIVPRLNDEQSAAEGIYRQSMQRFVTMADEFIAKLASSGASGVEHLSGVSGEVGFRVKSRFFLHELLTIVPQSLWTRIADSLRSRQAALRSIELAAGAYLDRMLSTNAARIENDLVERVLESRRRLEADLRGRLKELYSSAERALERAQARQAEGTNAVAAELARLDALRAKLDAVAE